MKNSLVASLLLTLPAWSQETPPVRDSLGDELDRAVLGGKWWLRLRYRLENVDQDGFDREAWASTLRTVLGYETGAWHGASVVLEFEDVSVVGNEQYDSTINGETDFPVVADPEGSEVNQAHLKVLLVEESTIKLGRQVITLDNHRFVGDVGWRQNQQTFDAATLLWSPLEPLSVFYAFVDNVNRVFGDDSPQGDHRMASHLVNAGYDVPGWGRITGYAYLLDYDSIDTNSTSTWGGRFAGSHAFGAAELQYAAEVASQSDTANNPNDVEQEYALAELGVRARGWTLRAGQEILGGSGNPGDAFQTPLATLHAFNGWADKFLTTPDTGLEDSYVGLGAKAGDFDLQLVWHDFQADSGGMDYGTELDASVVWAASKKVSVGVKFADYQADAFATDTTKAWIWLACAP